MKKFLITCMLGLSLLGCADKSDTYECLKGMKDKGTITDYHVISAGRSITMDSNSVVYFNEHMNMLDGEITFSQKILNTEAK